MMVIALGEILVVLLLRPIRFIVGGQKTVIGRGILRFENWILGHLHIMGAESKMRYELEKSGQASSFLAEGLTDQTSVMPGIGDTVERMRRETGATHADALRSNQLQDDPELRRGQRQVEPSGGDRSDDIHEAMLQAQRRKDQLEERARRRRP